MATHQWMMLGILPGTTTFVVLGFSYGSAGEARRIMNSRLQEQFQDKSSQAISEIFDIHVNPSLRKQFEDYFRKTDIPNDELDQHVAWFSTELRAQLKRIRENKHNKTRPFF